MQSNHISNERRKAFERQFDLYIVLSWLLPPVVGLSFLIYIQIFSTPQITAMMMAPTEPLFILSALIAAIFYLRHKIAPITKFVGDRDPDKAEEVEQALKAFPFHYWSAFLLYLLLAPSATIVSAELYSDFVATPADWFRVHLVALIVSIIVGLPIFFRIYDFFGKHLAPQLELSRPQLTIKTKVFLIGALVPLLIDTMIVQYYWTRTGFFTTETFAVWFLLELLAVAGSLMFVRSFSHSLQPLEKVINWSSVNIIFDQNNDLVAQSTDELGRLTHRYRDVILRLDRQKELLTIRNQILRLSSEVSDVDSFYQKIIEITEDIVKTDATFIFRFDAMNFQLTCIASSDESLREKHGLSLSLDRNSFCQTAFRLRTAIAISDTSVDSRIDSRMRETFEAKSIVGIPLFVNNESLGMLVSFNKKHKREFSEFDLNILDAVASELATIMKTQALDRRRVYAEKELQRINQQAAVTLQAIGDGVISTDALGNIEYINPVAEKLMGVSGEQVEGVHIDDVLQLTNGDTQQLIEKPIAMSLRQGKSYTIPGLVNLQNSKNLSEYAVEVRVSPILNDAEQVRGAVVVFHNVTELKRLSNKLAFQASHDELTGLLNRRAFEQRLNEMLEHSHQNKEQHALCYLDVDQFKVINDAHGHAAGDGLLKQMSEFLKLRLRRADVLARLGGDEFGLLLEGCDLEQAKSLTEELLEQLGQFYFRWNDAQYDVTVSAGLVPVEEKSTGIADLISAADTACYVAKELGRNRLHVYKTGDFILAQHKREMKWSQLIKAALAEKRFELYVQPITRLASGVKPYLFGEVLLRMVDKNGEIIMPNDFMPAAERYHLMPEIDRFVVKSAFECLQKCEKKNFAFSINLSSQTLCDDEFLDFVLKVMDECEIPPQSICFEITESVAISNLSRAKNFINTLKQKGCLFALDDFGSGLSSFSYLKNLSVDYLKIDGSFVKDIDRNEVDYAMVESVHHVARKMEIETIAEYVVNEAVYECVKKLGIDYAQGFYLAEPLPLEAGIQPLQAAVKMAD